MKNNYFNGGLTLEEVMCLEHRHVKGGEKTEVVVFDLKNGNEYFDGTVEQWYDSGYKNLREFTNDRGIYATLKREDDKFGILLY